MFIFVSADNKMHWSVHLQVHCLLIRSVSFRCVSKQYINYEELGQRHLVHVVTFVNQTRNSPRNLRSVNFR